MAKVSATTLCLGPDKGVSRLRVLGFGFRVGGVQERLDSFKTIYCLHSILLFYMKSLPIR